jgi:anti-sigma28 factor (negative regulator of flagellin synthesis)
MENSSAAFTLLAAHEQVQGVRPPSGAGIRLEKVRAIRQQLAEGRYSIADRLDVVVEKIIQDLR